MKGLMLPACVALLPLAASAQLAIDWFTVDGGGGTSSGGDFSVSGTIAQPDAGRSSGGSFTVRSGFWGSVSVVQTPGAPLLTVQRDPGGGLRVQWELPAEGWILESSPSLGKAPAPWSAVPITSYQSTATHRFIVIPNPAGKWFFRLRLP